MTRGRGLLLGLIVVGVSSVIGLAVMEGLVRWKFPQPTGLSHQDRYGLATHWPGITRYLPQFGHEVSFNSFGMRDREHEIAKAPGVFRVLVLGDSFMEAYQVPFDSSMPAMLEQALAARTGKRIEVVNAGVSGWGTDDELRYYTEYGRAMKPDLVVVAMTLHNDVSDNLRQVWHTEREGRLVATERAPIPTMEYRKIQLKGYIATRFQLYQLWRKVRHSGTMRQAASQLRSHVQTLFDDPLQEPTATGMRLTEQMLGRLDSLVTSDGGEMAVVMLPLMFQLKDSVWTQFAQTFPDSGRTVSRDRPQAVVQGITARLGIPTIDLLPEFRQWVGAGKPSLYIEWDGHWNVQGHRLATQVATDGLVGSGLVR
ncbi:MAG: SGNH/GDSL hydrolase family protein [Gemmatimonadaceae bacterium]|nr:SGNH/GDSL hydrolase family protein [Gemmatimonadaceae bacterium]